MKQYKKFAALLTAATMAVVTVNGFDIQAADRQVNAAQINSVEIYGGALASAGVLESIPETALNDTKNAAQKAQEQYQEKLRKEEEARKAAEEAQRAQEEAERLAAEQAAAEQAAQQNAMQASYDEQVLLASIIFCEAGNQPYDGQVAVGAVILNRVRSSVYPDSIAEVIYQSGQFGPAMSGWLDTVLANGGYTDTAMQAAADALAGSNPIGDCLYFGCGDYGIQIGDHFFH